MEGELGKSLAPHLLDLHPQLRFLINYISTMTLHLHFISVVDLGSITSQTLDVLEIYFTKTNTKILLLQI